MVRLSHWAPHHTTVQLRQASWPAFLKLTSKQVLHQFNDHCVSLAWETNKRAFGATHTESHRPGPGWHLLAARGPQKMEWMEALRLIA